MTKLRINLIRHGEKKLFLPDPGLTELGISQAEQLAQELFDRQKIASEAQTLHKKALILSSPKRRTQETAEIIAKKLKLEVEIDDFLNIDNVLQDNIESKKKIIKHFNDCSEKLSRDLNNKEVLEIFAITHSQEVRNFWQILGGPDHAIKDIYECGMWSIILDGERISFEWTEGDLNP
jgi:broad specificity phosphatase PhoE